MKIWPKKNQPTKELISKKFKTWFENLFSSSTYNILTYLFIIILFLYRLNLFLELLLLTRV